MAGSIHLQGIGGVGMAGIAFLLKQRGERVTGCDKYASPRTRWLEGAGIPVAVGHSPSHLAGVDELIVTPAVPDSDPELIEARSSGIRVRCRGEVLAELFNGADGIAVCGTHGKTTTATFTARLLQALGTDPSWCIGGETGDMPVAGVGTGPFVVEADESDGTLALYRARTLVVTSIDFDHPEHFKSPEAYQACYSAAMDAATDVIRAWELDADDWPELERLVLGRHNVSNARAAIEVALRRGFGRDAIAAALPFALAALPDRRFQTVAEANGIRVVTDYAHHPAELKCAMDMAAGLKPGRLRVLFQPHRYSRTKALLNEFPQAFAAADEVVLVPVYPAFEEPMPGGDIADLYRAFRDSPNRHRTILARSAEEAWRHAILSSRPGDLILLAGAGDIINLVPQVLRDLSSPHSSLVTPHSSLSNLSFFRTGGETVGGGERVIVGMGSNTWFSDCTTDIEIVRAPEGSTAARPGASLLADHPELYFMQGIPGTVGGWAKMNAGAFGDSFGNHIEYVIADGKKIPHDQCGFGYRTSSIPGLITDVALRAPAAPAQGKKIVRKTFPPRTCGSVFKNPSPDMPAGRLLEEAGAKSMRVGGAYVWAEHANVIVAGEGCTSSDILALARLMARAVMFSTGIRLEPEIRGLSVW